MFDRPLSRTALAAAFLGTALAASAQLNTNVPALERMSRSLTRQTQTSEAQARSWAVLRGFPLRRELPDGGLIVLSGWRNGGPEFITTRGRDAAITIGAHRLWPGGETALNLTGTGITLGIWEAAANPEVSHREFTNRVFIQDGNTLTSDHATHVAGIMSAAGINARARGIAYASTLHAWDASNDAGEAALAAARALDPIRASNHSYGFATGWIFGALGDGRYVWFGDTRVSATEDYRHGQYSSTAAAWDLITFNAPYYLPVAAAGNTRNAGPANQPVTHWVFNFETGEWSESDDVRYDDSTYDTLPGDMAAAKNTLTVGAVEEIPGGYTDPSDVVAADFTSWGPTDDGRIKPDLVAAGVDVFAPVDGNNYAEFSGTSMAAPGVTGGVGLLMQYYRANQGGADMRASTLKALLIHTAEEAGDHPGPDYAFGWGLANIGAAAEHIQGSLFNANALRDVVLNNGATVDIPIAVSDGGPIKVTIAWTDPAAPAQGAVVDDTTPRLVNDVDLRVIRNSDSTVFLPWALDPADPSAAATTGDNTVDNVEQVVLDMPTAGVYTIRLTHKGTLRNPSQVVSVVVTAPEPSGFSGFEITPDTVVGGSGNAVGTITLAEAPVSNETITLFSSNPAAASVPSSVTVPANATSIDFPIITRSVRPAAGQSSVVATIIASSSIGTRSSQLTIEPITVADFTLSADSVVGGNTITGTITLNAPAPTSGAAVAITSNLPRTARAQRNWVTVRRGQQSATFTIRTFPVAENKNVVLTARRLGNSVQQTLTVSRAGVGSLVATPTSVTGTNPISLRVNLDGPAPTTGAVVQLRSSNPALLPVPATMNIGARRTFGTLTLTPTRAGGGAQVTITATRFGQSTSTTVTLN